MSEAVPPDPTELATSGVVTNRGIFRGFSASYTNVLLSAITSLLATPLYLRLLGAENYGLWLTVSSVLTYLSLSAAGLPQATQNRMAEEHATGEDGNAAQVLATSVWCTVLFVFLTSCMGYVLVRQGVISSRLFRGSPSLQRTAIPVLLVSGAGYLASLPLQQFRGALRAVHRVAVAEGVSAAGGVVATAMGLMVLLLGGSVIGFAASQTLVLVVFGLIMMTLALRALPAPSRRSMWRFRPRRAQELLAPSFHFLVISLAGALIWGTDNVVISSRLGASQVPKYAVSLRLFTLASSAIGAVAISLLPSVTALWVTGQTRRLQRLTIQVTRLIMIASLLVTVELTFFGRSFLRLWAGHDAVPPPSTFLLFAAIFLVRSFAQAQELVVIGMARQRAYAAVVAAEGLANLGFTLALVGPLGLSGVALGTLCAHLAATGWFLPWYASRCTSVRVTQVLRESILPVVPATAVAIGVAAIGSETIGAGSWFSLTICMMAVAASFSTLFLFVSSNKWERHTAGRLYRILRRERTTS